MSFDATGGDTENSFGIGGRGRIRAGGRADLVEATGDIVWVPVNSGDITSLTGVMTVTPGIGGAGGASMEVEYKGGTAVEGPYPEVSRLRRLWASDSVKAPE